MLKSVFTTRNVTDTASSDVEGVGALRWKDNNLYRWVENTVTNFTPGVGDIVCHAYADTTTALQRISKPATATLTFLAGVCLTTISASTGTNPKRYGWIQVFGRCGSVNVTPANTQTTAGPTTGESLKPVNAAVWAAQDATTGAPPTYRRSIQALQSVAAGTTTTSIAGFVHCI